LIGKRHEAIEQHELRNRTGLKTPALKLNQVRARLAVACGSSSYAAVIQPSRALQRAPGLAEFCASFVQQFDQAEGLPNLYEWLFPETALPAKRSYQVERSIQQIRENGLPRREQRAAIAVVRPRPYKRPTTTAG